MATTAYLRGEGWVTLLQTAEEVGDRTPSTVGIGVYPKGVPVELQRCYSCGKPTRNWFGFRNPTDCWAIGEIYFLCNGCEGPEEQNANN